MVRLPVGAVVHQLTDFLTTVAESGSRQDTVSDAVERIAEAFGAEVGAFVEDERVVASIGYPAASVPTRAIVGAIADADGLGTLAVPGSGRQPSVVVPVDAERRASLVLARAGDPFDPDEMSLISGIAGALGVGLRMQATLEVERTRRVVADRQAADNRRALDRLRHRHRLLELLATFASSPAARRPLDAVLADVTSGAFGVLDVGVVTLWLPDADGQPTLRSSAGLGADDVARLAAEGLDDLCRMVLRERRVFVIDDYPALPGAAPAIVEAGATVAMAAPVMQDGHTVGCLMVADSAVERRFTHTEQDALVALAGHTGVLLGDAEAQQEVDLALEEAMHRAMHDTLTQLPNRALLLDRLGQALARARRSTSEVAVLFIDLDDFKVVNDSLGHTAGDQVLVAVSGALAQHVRAGDTAARLGGDEFAVLLQDVIRPGEAEVVAQRIISSVTRPMTIGGNDVTISVSIGIALADGNDRAEVVLLHADTAMYAAKTAGKNRIEMFSAGVTPSLF